MGEHSLVTFVTINSPQTWRSYSDLSPLMELVGTQVMNSKSVLFRGKKQKADKGQPQFYLMLG
jgi:hypothetical protein